VIDYDDFEIDAIDSKSFIINFKYEGKNYQGIVDEIEEDE